DWSSDVCSSDLRCDSRLLRLHRLTCFFFKTGELTTKPCCLTTPSKDNRCGNQQAEHRSQHKHRQHDDDQRYIGDDVISKEVDVDRARVLEREQQYDDKHNQPQNPDQIPHVTLQECRIPQLYEEKKAPGPETGSMPEGGERGLWTVRDRLRQ